MTLGLIAGARAAAAPLPEPAEKPGAKLLPRGIPLSNQIHKEIIGRVVTHPGVAPRTHRLSAIRTTLGTATDASGGTTTIATIVLFDHTAGEARRVLLDVHSGELLGNSRLPGRPQASREELKEAAQIVRGDNETAALLEAGAVLDGGFVVADPGGSRRRMVQLKLLSADRVRLLRSITVDLTRGVIASPPGEQGTADASRTGTPGTRGGMR
jgi:hypothetical protein